MILKVLAFFFVLLLVFLVLIVVQALDQLGRQPVLGRPIWVPAASGVALTPVSAAVVLVLSLAVVGLAIHFGRRKGKGPAAKD